MTLARPAAPDELAAAFMRDVGIAAMRRACVDSERSLVCLTGSNVTRSTAVGVVDLCFLPHPEECVHAWTRLAQEIATVGVTRFGEGEGEARAWAFPPDRAFLRTEHSSVASVAPPVHDLALLRSYRGIHDPSRRLAPWQTRITQLTLRDIDVLAAPFLQRLAATPRTDRARAALAWYNDRVRTLREGELPKPLMQVQRVRGEPLSEDVSPARPTSAVAPSVAAQRIQKWAMRLLPKAEAKSRSAPVEIIRSQLGVAYDWLAAELGLDVPERGPVAAHDIDALWQAPRAALPEVPAWVIPVE